ncbi:MAG: hypothetical protein COX06_01695 [Candidatus Zambryskibacteria bacterium CG22_combo_CG10-13_8_21_14_all_42_17]|uniref:Uncharacterized protein n=1 Tax=Candidatus Zambryskibacteria bacterium CG22_combo_CG10-13_8_21_14_all_42_17 TaxID=1975118 RepID=A0A2H0BDK5_9BACT|nr:MAG: hypothetical protein COX06_01695 [Candidatus Zambryskibacteria bacterium CG22_combo_CG10-13_8_21_14_all_42_17]
MDGNKVLDVIALYRQKLEKVTVNEISHPYQALLPNKDVRKRALLYCYNMLSKIEGFVAENRMDKVFRWLGFIQGVLWVLQVFSLDDLKNHNRPAE